VDVTIEHERTIFGSMTATPKKEAPKTGSATPAKVVSATGGN
jgi:hypothetical protein